VTRGGTAPGSRAPLVEIFHSIQGEGRFVGQAMGFVRVAVCPIRCRYCDTPHSYTAAATFPVGDGATRRDERNPVSGATAARLALACERASTFGTARSRAVSLTGGEPLVYPRFALELGTELRANGVRLHLETAALDPDALATVLPVVDHLSADWKSPATLASGDPTAANLACVALAAAGSATIDVKLVLTADVTLDAVRDAVSRLHPHRVRVLLILQPVTPFGAVTSRAPTALVAAAHRHASAEGFDVRVVPQVHKQLGVE
jgi:7-carboxy-7-deazaguanine synthase